VAVLSRFLLRGHHTNPTDTAGLDPVAGFAFFVEVVAAGVVDHGDREVLHLEAADGLSYPLGPMQSWWIEMA